MMTPNPDPITRLFRACAPDESLKPDDPRYVILDDVRGENVAKIYERSLRRADPASPEVKLFAGHRGVGKTSELLRLKNMLEQSSERSKAFKVIYFDVAQTLDVNDLDFPDLLVFTAAQVQAQLKEAQIPEFSVVNTYLNRVWDGIKGVLGSEVSVSGAEAGPDFASVAIELKNRPNARTELRNQIELQSSSLLKGVNDLLDSALVALRRADYEGLVVIIDGLDKVVRRPLEDGRNNTHERLFIHRSEQLASLQAHTIYTVPISLYYSPLCAQLEQTCGEFNFPLPMVRLRGENKAPITPETPGMIRMWEIIKARCRYAQVEISQVFDSPATGDYLCEMTGGHPRHLMMLIQSALNELDTLPITRAAVEKAIRNYANSLFREIPSEYWPLLKHFQEPQSDMPKDEMHEQMLLLLHVFEYMNGQPWYEVNPVIRTIPKYQSA